MKLRTTLYFVLLASLILTSSLAAQTIGMVADNATKSVTVFDADTNTIKGSIYLSSSNTIGDCAITSDNTLGFVTDFNYQVWVIDLTKSPPSLATGTNPIDISNPGEDVVITPDGKYILICDGNLNVPISVVDIASRSEISTFHLGTDCNSIDVASDGSVVATSRFPSTLRRLTVDSSGTLTDTGDAISTGVTLNAYIAKSGNSCVVLDYYANQIVSYTIPGFGLVDVRDLSGYPVSGFIIDETEGRVFVRSWYVGIEGFTFDSLTAAIGTTPVITIGVSNPASSYYGMEQMALHPDGTKIYVPEPNALNVYDLNTGVQLASITHSSIVTPTGVCLSTSANLEPVADAGGPYIEPATDWETLVALDGSNSTDPEGGSLTYVWDLDLAVDSDVPADGNPANDVDATGALVDGLFPIGTTDVSLTVTDSHGAVDTAVTTVTITAIDVLIDIKPGSYPNSINLGSNGVIPVAFITTEDFDASTIDPLTVVLRGEDFADGLVKLRGKKQAPMAHLDDFDSDGDLDLIVQLDTENLASGIPMDATCELGAITFNGFVVTGFDSVNIVPE